MTALPKQPNLAEAVLAACRRLPWFNAAECTAMTPELHKVIARCLGSYAFSMQGARWAPQAEALRLAWDAYCDVNAEAKAAELAEDSCPF